MEQVNVGGDYGTGARGSGKNVLSCGGGGYIIKVNGNHDHNRDIKKFTSLLCKSVYDDSEYEVHSNLGTDPGGGSGFNSCKELGAGMGLVGFRTGSDASLETLSPICKQWGANKVDFSSQSRMGKSQKTWNNSCMTGINATKQDLAEYGAGPYTYVQELTGYNGQRFGNVVGFGYTCANMEHVLKYRKDNPDVTPKVECCTSPSPSFGCSQMKTAMAAGRPSFNCDSVMRSYCDGASGKFLEPACATWYSDPTRKRERASKVWEYCQAGNNFETALCKEFCTSDTGASTEFPEYKGMCNTLYDTKCADENNQGRDVCSCHRPFSSYTNADMITKIHGLEDPRCYFQECIKTGYHKMPRNTLGCPQCLQNLEVNIGAATDTELQNIRNVCNVPGEEDADAPPEPEYTDPDPPITKGNNNQTLIIAAVAGGMMLLLLVIAIA